MGTGDCMIYIDDRTGSKELADLIENAVLVHLDFGDAMFSGCGPDGEVQIGVERKAIGDLINSIASGRLSGHQLPGLLETYFKTYLFVEGVCQENPASGELEVLRGTKWTHLNRGGRKFAYKDVWAYLTTLEAMTGIVVRNTVNMLQTASQIEWLKAWWSKPWDKHRGHLQIHKVPPRFATLKPTKPSLLKQIAADLPNIGWERATAVEKQFGSVRRMFEASEEEWREVEGIGKLTSRKVWEALHG